MDMGLTLKFRASISATFSAARLQGHFAHKSPPLDHHMTLGYCRVLGGGCSSGVRFPCTMKTRMNQRSRESRKAGARILDRGSESHTWNFRGTSLLRKRLPLGPYSDLMPRAL